MTTLIEKLREDLLTARKNGDTIVKGCLTPLISDCEAVGKKCLREVTDDEVIEVIKSFIKRANISLEAYTTNNETSSTIVKEIEILESYLPKQLDDVEIQFIISACIDEGMSNIGKIMKHFKDEYNGQYDAALVSKMVKERFV